MRHPGDHCFGISGWTGTGPAGASQHSGPYFNGRMRPWHGRDEGSIPSGSTRLTRSDIAECHLPAFYEPCGQIATWVHDIEDRIAHHEGFLIGGAVFK